MEGKTHFITTALISNPALVRASRVFLPGILSQDLWDHSHRKCAPLGFSHAAIQSRPEIPARSPLLARVIVGRYFSSAPHRPQELIPSRTPAGENRALKNHYFP